MLSNSASVMKPSSSSSLSSLSCSAVERSDELAAAAAIGVPICSAGSDLLEATAGIAVAICTAGATAICPGCVGAGDWWYERTMGLGRCRPWQQHLPQLRQQQMAMQQSAMRATPVKPIHAVEAA